MPNFNRVVLAGNLTQDPDLRYTADGTPVCSLSLAINSNFTTSGGEKKSVATFVPITVWRKQAETSAEYLKKGRSILIEGRIKQENWVNKEGQKRSRLTVVANQVTFLGTPPKKEEPSPETPEPEQPAQE
ncbi:Single-stranded DNA-binding protein A [subsurface metagenome]